MRGGARFLGHSIHPMLVAFPLGLLTLVPLVDIVRFVTGDAFWSRLAFWQVWAGIVTAGLAAIAGLFDWLAVPRGTRAWRIGLMHMLVNLSAVALFVVSAVLRLQRGMESATRVPFVLGLGGMAILFVGGWFGGELVERLSVGVWEDANVNAPSSLDQERLIRRPPEAQGPSELRPA